MNDAAAIRLVRAVSLLVVAVALVVSVRGLERLNTWYLASDQFAFLTQAADLRDGRLTRSDWFYDFTPAREQRAYDAYAQTYRLKEGRLHSRYPPGFSVLLALAGALLGPAGEHGLNPVLFLVVMVVLARLTYVALRGVDAGVAFGAAASVVWLLLLLPTDVHLWGITVARDLPAHLLGLSALLAAIGGRFGWAGLALGLACVVRPDAALYAASLAAVALVRGGVVAAAVRGAAGFVVGVTPLLAYNWAVLGHPFSFTQGSEIRYFFASLSPFASVAHAADVVIPAGGGLRVVHFAATFAGNLRLLSRSFGWFVVPAGVALVWGLAYARVFVAAFVPYAIIATIFYGFWSHPDPRYLSGVSLCLMALVAGAIVLAARRVLDPAAPWPWRVAALALSLATLAPLAAGAGVAFLPLPSRTAAATAALMLVLVAATPWSRRSIALDRLRPLVPLGPALLWMALGLLAVAGGSGLRDPYQRAAIARAKEVLEETVPPGSVLITSPSLGRPAENITYYSGVRAAYASELPMVGASSGKAATFHKLRGRRVFFLLPPREVSEIEALPKYLQARIVRRIPPQEALDWFMNPRRAREGAILYEIEVAPAFRPLADFIRKRASPSAPHD